MVKLLTNETHEPKQSKFQKRNGTSERATKAKRRIIDVRVLENFVHPHGPRLQEVTLQVSSS